ncbi:MAG: peptidoglycan-binding protein [Symploca sp. SIO2C1]|nr:peptidoglycan-binding protein [Symploca sp. SIO2C1]
MSNNRTNKFTLDRLERPFEENLACYKERALIFLKVMLGNLALLFFVLSSVHYPVIAISIALFLLLLLLQKRLLKIKTSFTLLSFIYSLLILMFLTISSDLVEKAQRNNSNDPAHITSDPNSGVIINGDNNTSQYNTLVQSNNNSSSNYEFSVSDSVSSNYEISNTLVISNNKDFIIGSENLNVLILEYILNKTGDYQKSYSGVFDEYTLDSLKKFQERNNLKTVGTMTSETCTALQAATKVLDIDVQVVCRI